MQMPGVREKMIKSSKGRKFVERGGNGTFTKQQLAVHKATGLVMEYAIPTRDVKHLFQKIPNSYKSDLACIEKKISIEIDGKKHKLRSQIILDAKKTKVLNSLGWKVLRFWNEEVDNDMKGCVKKIMSMI